MKSIDAEIFEVEQRLHLREASLKRNAVEVKNRSIKALMSPVSIVAAVALGFLVAGGIGRRKAKAKANAPVVSQETKEQTKGFAVGGLLMTAATWFLKNQFGGPVGLAQYVISKLRKDRAPTQTPARVTPTRVTPRY
jgi:hypothetical protein